MSERDNILTEIRQHQEVTAKLHEQAFLDSLENAVEMVVDTIKNGKKLLIFGNGGSASDAQHIAAEFTGRFVRERRGLPAIALTTDTSALTAIGNDYGFTMIFARQVEALAQPADLVIGISTSGNSENVIQGLNKAKELGCRTIALTGNTGGKMAALCDTLLNIDSPITARVQEMHILVGHILCKAVDARCA